MDMLLISEKIFDEKAEVAKAIHDSILSEVLEIEFPDGKFTDNKRKEAFVQAINGQLDSYTAILKGLLMGGKKDGREEK